MSVLTIDTTWRNTKREKGRKTVTKNLLVLTPHSITALYSIHFHMGLCLGKGSLLLDLRMGLVVNAGIDEERTRERN